MKNIVRHRKLVVSISAISLLFITKLTAQELPAGQIIDTVQCLQEKGQSYALYLPSNYNASQQWPAVFIFEPAARGSLPLNNFKKAADKYGYIVACSNNSRNGPWDKILAAADAMLADVQDRFSVNKARIYTSGFSGGSRAAMSVAVITNEVAGVVGCGGGMPNVDGYKVNAKSDFDYIGVVGDKDMNNLEHRKLQTEMMKMGVKNHLIIFDGIHQWPPEEAITEAFMWLQVMGMERDIIALDEAEREVIFQHFVSKAETLVKDEKMVDAFNLYEEIEYQFVGNENVAVVTDARLELEKSKEYQSQLKDRNKVVKKEEKWQALLLEGFSEMHLTRLEPRINEEEEVKDLAWWRKQLGFITKGQKNKDGEEKLMYDRLHNFVWANMAERSFSYESRKDYEMTLKLVEIWLYAQPDQVWPNWYAAKIHALKGNRKEALDFLEKAYSFGMKNPKSLEGQAAFNILEGEQRYQAILQKLRSEEL